MADIACSRCSRLVSTNQLASAGKGKLRSFCKPCDARRYKATYYSNWLSIRQRDTARHAARKAATS